MTGPSGGSAKKRLLPQHRDDLRKSGLSDETIALSGCYSVNAQESVPLVGFAASGMAIPYPDTELDDGRALIRIKRDQRKAPGGKPPAKYVSPKSEIYPEGNRLYIPANFDPAWGQDPKVPILITEGEKKTLKANQEGFACIGLSGVYNWKAKGLSEVSRPLDDFEVIRWRKRLVFIAFDSDIVDKPQVRQAAESLRAFLWGQGARVAILILPGPSAEEDSQYQLGGKFGLDDFLVARGPKALTELLAEAEANMRHVNMVTGRQDRDIHADARAALLDWNDPPELFRHSKVVVTVGTEEGVPTLEPASTARVASELARSTDWVRAGKHDSWEAASQPPFVANWLVAEPEGLFPPVRRAVSTPVFDSLGNLVCTNGYHAASQIFVSLAEGLVGDWPDPTTVTRADAEAAIRLIREDWFGDFPFAEDSDFAHHSAALLLPLVREMVLGPTPLHLYTAPARGVGKSKLAQNVAIVHTGKATVQSFPDVEEEREKRFSALLLRGDPVHIFDNVDKVLSSPALAMLATSEEFMGRILGISKMVSLQNRATWLFTGKNPTSSDEIARRIVDIRLTPQSEKPWDRPMDTFRQPHLDAWTRAHRRQLLGALITLVVWWIRQGKPVGQGTKGSYEGWIEVVGGIIQTAGIPGFLENANSGTAERVLYDPLEALLQQWGRRDPGTAFTARGLLEHARAHWSAEVTIPEDWNTGKLGSRLGRSAGILVAGYRLVKEEFDGTGTQRWGLRKLTPPDPAASSPGQPEPSLAADAAPCPLDLCGEFQRSSKGPVKVQDEKSASQADNPRVLDLLDLDPYSTHAGEDLKREGELLHVRVGGVGASKGPEGPVDPPEASVEADNPVLDLYWTFAGPLPEGPEGPVRQLPPTEASGPAQVGGARRAFERQPAHGALEEVQRIAVDALALGWTEDQLFRTQDTVAYPSGDYGLVCFLPEGSTVVEVTSQAIGFLTPEGRRGTYHNQKADQPWLRRVASSPGGGGQ